MKITIASLSNIGERATNQDAIGYKIGERSACFVVCDGIAGQPGGEIAAETAKNSILNAFGADLHLDSQKIRQYIIAANEAVQEQQKQTIYHKMGATLVSLFIDRDYGLAYWAHVGDSRLYLFRRGSLYSVTTDHSLVEQMRQSGYQTTGVNSNILYLALGLNGLNEGKEASYSDVLQLEDGDSFLLCTDGLWNTLDIKQVEFMLHIVKSPEEWLAMMRKAWSKNNNGDNCSAIVVWIGEPQDMTLLYPASQARDYLHLDEIS